MVNFFFEKKKQYERNQLTMCFDMLQTIITDFIEAFKLL